MDQLPGHHAAASYDAAAAGLPGLLIVSGVRFLRESLEEIFRRDCQLSMLGSCGALDEAVAMCRAAQPAVILLDASFPGAFLAVDPLRAAAPDGRVVALAVNETEETVIEWAEAGAAGYVSSSAALADLAGLLLDIVQGRQTCSAVVAGGLFRRLSDMRPAPVLPAAVLTTRERQIIGLIGAGMSNKDIARHLNIGVATAKSHVHNLLSKLNVQRRGQAVGLMRGHRI